MDIGKIIFVKPSIVIMPLVVSQYNFYLPVRKNTNTATIQICEVEKILVPFILGPCRMCDFYYSDFHFWKH